MKMNNKGFTLVELLAVLAIIAIIGGIAIPNVISLMDNNKKDHIINDAQRLISLAKNAVAADREFRANTDVDFKKYQMSILDTKNSINPDPDGGNYDRVESYVKYTKNSGYCVYLKGTKKVVKSDSGSDNCVPEERLNRSAVKDL
jgi:prepilin-type N-terminal cleavage/methylation domain-containing protein